MKILFITLSNIGDCILTLPVLDALRQKYPLAEVTCLVPDRPSEIFINNPAIERVIIFDKYTKLSEKIKLFFSLSRENFDIVVDLRNSFFGAFLPVKKRSSPLRIIPAEIKHSKDRHLFWAGFGDDFIGSKLHESLTITPQDSKYIDDTLSELNLINSNKLIVVSPGARSHVKCWDKQSFSQLCRQLLMKVGM